MVSFAKNTLSLLLVVTCTLIPYVAAQLGTVITSPAANSTVTAGEKVTIQFTYGNMGTGAYNADIDLYQDSGMTTLITNVVQGYDIKDGNSTGVQLADTLNDTYVWEVPHGLTETAADGTKKPVEIFYLAVTPHIETAYFQGMELRSGPLLLHYSAGVLNTPAPIVAILTLIVSALFVF